VQHILTLSRTAVVVRHWFEIDLEDASMEHGARIELRELAAQPHRGSESAAQLITLDRPLWRADLFDRLDGRPGNFGAAHYHPEFSGNEPCPRVWDPELTAAPWSWLRDPGQRAVAAGAGRRGRYQRAGRGDRDPGAAAGTGPLPIGRGVPSADPGRPGVRPAHDRASSPARPARPGVDFALEGHGVGTWPWHEPGLPERQRLCWGNG